MFLKASRWSEKCPDDMKSVWMIWKKFRKFETAQIIWKVSRCDLWSVHVIWEVFRWYAQCLGDLESGWMISKTSRSCNNVLFAHLNINSDSFFYWHCNQNFFTHFCLKFYNVAVYVLYLEKILVENPYVRKVFAFSDSAPFAAMYVTKTTVKLKKNISLLFSICKDKFCYHCQVI